jgi:hypothetical protein
MYYALNLFRIYVKNIKLVFYLFEDKKNQILFYRKGVTIKPDSFNKSFLTSFSIL